HRNSQQLYASDKHRESEQPQADRFLNDASSGIPRCRFFTPDVAHFYSNRQSNPSKKHVPKKPRSCPISFVYRMLDLNRRNRFPWRNTLLNLNQIGTIGVSIFDTVCRMDSCRARIPAILGE